MNTKFGLSLVVFAALVLSIAAVSALTVGESSNVLTINQNTSDVLVSNTGSSADNFSLSISNIISGSNQVVLSLDKYNLNDFNGTSTVKVSATSFSTGFKFGRYDTQLTVTSLTNSSNTKNSTITYFKSFCKNGARGDLEITKVDLSSDGDDDNNWKALDKITVDVRVENTGDDDINDVVVALGLIDNSGNDQADELNYISEGNEEISLGDLNDGDDDIVTFEFTVPADFNTDDYTLVVKAYSDDDGESKICADSSDLDSTGDAEQSVSIEQETDDGKFIAFDNIQVSPSEGTCGDTVTLSLDAYNIGDEDQDQVRVNLISNDLNLNQYVEIKSGLDVGDKESLTFTFAVPRNIADKTYKLVLDSEYDYTRGDYKQSSDDSFEVPFKVFGCNAANEEIASISATLGSEAVAGKDLVVNARITNTGSSSATFEVSAAGYDSWASETVGSQAISLAAGESRDVALTFKVNSDVSGEKSFVLNVRNGADVATKQVVVSIGKSSSNGMSLSDSNLIWIIAGVNIILILIIIIVAVRIARR